MNLRNTLLRGIATGAVLLLPGVLAAQSPRMVLVEEATNASCPPCAAQNPFFEYYLDLPHNEASIIPITWHSNFPGADVMNKANPTMHDGRVAYYGISGVPTAVVNGRVQPASSSSFYSGAPADTVAIANGANQVRGTMSPITIAIEETRAGKDVTVKVTVSSTEAIVGKTLRIVAVEGHHNYASAGTNGEKDFFMVSRQALPSLAGTPITLAAGESTTITESYTIASEWKPSEMHTVAYMQDDATKEVLQAATNKTESSFNTTQTPTIVMKAGGDEPTHWDGTLATNTPGAYIVSIVPTYPTGWSSAVTIDGRTVVNGDTVRLAESAPLNVSIDQANGRPGKGSVTVTVEGGRAGRMSKTFKLYAGDIDAMVITRSESTYPIPRSYEDAFKKGTFSYAFVDYEDEGMINFNDYKALVVQSGKQILFAEDVAMLKNYLDKGGNLFIAGAEIAWALADPSITPSQGIYQDVEFLNNYLHADYVADGSTSTKRTAVTGTPNDIVSGGMTFSIASGINNQDTPDHIAPLDGAVPMFRYGAAATDPIAGIRYESENQRMIYLGFGLEGMGDINKRSALLNRGINWLITGQATGVETEENTVTGSMMQSARPNPATGTFELPITLTKGSHVTIALYNSQGEKVMVAADRSFPAGWTAISVDATSLPAGVYTAVITAGGTTASTQISIVR